MQRIPAVEERKWLGRSLRKLIEKRGIDSFVSAQILEPTPACFPDPWSGRLADVHRLTQRLMHAAGLEHLRFTLTGVDAGEHSEEMWDRGTAGWFAGIVDGRCLFGVHESQLRDPESTVGVMAHEVAHAYREHHRLVVDDRDREEPLTDLTTIYLGFGIFTTNNTDRYRSSGNARMTSWSIQSAGYLPPQEMAWLLALQAVARNDRRATKRVLEYLEPNQRSYFGAAIREIESNSAYIDDLRLPPRARWRSQQRATPIAVAEPAAEDIDALPAVDLHANNRNAGVAALRVENTSKVVSSGLGAIYGLVAGLIAGIAISEDYSGTGSVALIMALVGAVAGAALVLRFARYFKCSECGQKAHAHDAMCSECGATLGNTATEGQLRAHRAHQLDARPLEDWEECADCRPENACGVHRATVDVDKAWFADS